MQIDMNNSGGCQLIVGRTNDHIALKHYLKGGKIKQIWI